MKKLLAFLGVWAMALTFVGGGAALTAKPDSNPLLKAVAPAQAGAAWGTAVTHAGDDSGYTGDIHIVCNNGNHFYLKPGQGTALSSSNTNCSLSGVDRIIVAYNQTVYCKNYAPPYENTYFYTGTNYVPSNRTYKCYAQRPL